MKVRRLLSGALFFASVACQSRLPRPPTVFPMKEVFQGEKLEGRVEPPLATDGTRLFVGARLQEDESALDALDAMSGVLEWRAPFEGGRVAAAPGLLVVRSTDGTATGLDPVTGRLRWRTSTLVTGELPPVLEGEVVLVGGDGLAALDAATGRLLWSQAEPKGITATPRAAAGRVFTIDSEGAVHCRRLDTGERIWTFEAKARKDGGLVVDEDSRVFVATASRTLVAARVPRKKKDWRWRFGCDVPFSPALSGGSVIVAGNDATLYAFNRKTGQLNWRASLPSRPISAPLVAGRVVFVACLDREIPGYDASTGRRLGLLLTDHPMVSAPVLLADRIYVALDDRTLWGFSMNLTPFEPERPPGKGTI